LIALTYATKLADLLDKSKLNGLCFRIAR